MWLVEWRNEVTFLYYFHISHIKSKLFKCLFICYLFIYLLPKEGVCEFYLITNIYAHIIF